MFITLADRCYFDTKGAVCSKHRSVVCGICCSDYYLFNKLCYVDQIDDNKLNRAIKNYLKKPQKIARSGSKRMCNPGMESLFTSTISSQCINLIELVTLCGFICFSARFIPQKQDRVIGVVKFAIQTYSESNKHIAFDKIEKCQRVIKKDINKRKKKRKKKMKQEQLKKQKEFKEKGIRRRIKNVKPSFSQKLRNGEVDIFSPLMTIQTLLTRNGCTSFGSFFKQFEDTFPDVDDGPGLDQKLNDLMMAAGANPNDMIYLNNTHTDTMKSATKRVEFALKYGKELPIDDPKKWKERKIIKFLMEHDISPKPKPTKGVLIRVVEELIEIKAILLQVCIGFDGFNDLENQNDDETNIVVDAQKFIPMNCNPFILKSWNRSISISKLFALCSMSTTTKPFKDICDSFVVMTSRIDKCDSIDEIPIFIVQEDTDTMALVMIVVDVKVNQSLPMVVIKYHFGVKGKVDPRELMCEMKKGKLMQSVPADLTEIKLLSRLLKKNRNKLNSEIVEKNEKKYGKGWRLSVFVPFQKEEKKCPTCNQLATLRCSRCKIQCYCSQECQKLHWKKHKKVCKK